MDTSNGAVFQVSQWNRWGGHKGFAIHNKQWRITTGLRASNFPSTSVTFSSLHTLKIPVAVGLSAISGFFLLHVQS